MNKAKTSPPRAWRTAALLALWAGATVLGCRGCQETGGPAGILELASGSSAGVLWVPDLGDAASQLEGFLGRATQKAGAAAVRRLREGVVKQLGFDPLRKEDYAKVGVNPSAGLLIFVEEGGREPLLAIGI